MGFYLYDEDGYVDDLGTTKGTNDLLVYLRGLDIPGLKKFLTEGWDLVPEALAEELEEVNAPAGEIRDTLEALKENLYKCKGIAIISDGLNEGVESADEQTRSRVRE